MARLSPLSLSAAVDHGCMLVEDWWNVNRLNRRGRDVARLARKVVQQAGERQFTLLPDDQGIIGVQAHDAGKAWVYLGWSLEAVDPKRSGQSWLLDTSWVRGNVGTRFVAPKSGEIKASSQIDALSIAARGLRCLRERSEEVAIVQDDCGEELEGLMWANIEELESSSQSTSE